MKSEDKALIGEVATYFGIRRVADHVLTHSSHCSRTMIQVMTYQNEGVCYPLDSPEFAAVQATLDEEWINPISTLFESNDFLLVPSDYGGTLAADLTGRPIGGVRLLILDGCDLPIGVSLIAKEKCESDLLVMMQELEEILGGFVKPKAVMRGYW